MEDVTAEEGLPISSYVGTSGAVTAVAYDLSKQNLATVSSEGTVSVFTRSVTAEEWLYLSEWKSEGGYPLTQVAWAHPEFGGLLAVGGSQGEVSLWRRHASTQGEDPASPSDSAAVGSSFRLEGTVAVRGGVTALAFGARERGLHLAVASETSCSVLRPKGAGLSGWQVEGRVGPQLSQAKQHTCLCWQPFSQGIPPVLLLGSINGAKVFMYEEVLMKWREVKTLLDNAEVVSVDWDDSGGRPHELVAVAHGTTVQILGLKGAVDNLQVEGVAELENPAKVVKVGWHPRGWLAVSLEGALLHLWRANLAGEWNLIRRLVGIPEPES